MGTIQGFCASSHASAICAGVAPLRSASFLHDLDEGQVRPPQLRREARSGIAEVVRFELGDSSSGSRHHSEYSLCSAVTG
jgi:hypothetical protein